MRILMNVSNAAVVVRSGVQQWPRRTHQSLQFLRALLLKIIIENPSSMSIANQCMETPPISQNQQLFSWNHTTVLTQVSNHHPLMMIWVLISFDILREPVTQRRSIELN
jgi:hypothetical protein